MFSWQICSEDSTKFFFAQRDGFINTEHMLRNFIRHTLAVSSQVKRVAVVHPTGQEQLKTIALHLESFLTRPSICDRGYPEKLSTASAGKPVCVTKPSSLLLFVEHDKKPSEESTSLKETYFLTTFGNKSMNKISLGVKTCIKSHCCTPCSNFSSIQVIFITLKLAESLKL